MIIKLYELINGDDTLRNRDTAKKIIEIIAKEPESNQVVIDFDKIEFATRSFLNELLSNLYNRKVSYINTNRDIEKMMKISFKNSFSNV